MGVPGGWGWALGLQISLGRCSIDPGTVPAVAGEDIDVPRLDFSAPGSSPLERDPVKPRDSHRGCDLAEAWLKIRKFT